MTEHEDDAARRVEVERGLADVRERIAQAAALAGRDPAGVTLVVVTKTFPVSDVRLLAELGVRDVGENRDQEAAVKASACAALGLRWHFVGQLQTNKAASVAAYADVVHSVDRLRLVDALQRGAAAAERELDALVQVDLGEDVAGRSGRGGAGPDELGGLAAAVRAAPSLRLRGLMAVAPLGADAARCFARLADVAGDLRAAHPDATWLSAGMSEDFETAVEAGATHVRIGSAILGRRPPLR
jgi:pyridoxal phosphate enzyme (YggS family)